jgi:hypothetical protein
MFICNKNECELIICEPCYHCYAKLGSNIDSALECLKITKHPSYFQIFKMNTTTNK